MKTAEDFRNDFGDTEESFRACVRQTLTALECEEEKPVKKKINMGLVLALAVLLLTGTAVADEQWGILSFLQSRGKTATEDQLLELYDPVIYYPDGTVAEPWRPDDALVEATMTEALYEDGKLYMSITLKPVVEKALVVPVDDPLMGKRYKYRNYIGESDQDLAAIPMQAALNDPAYGDASVLDYAKANGFETVVLMHDFAISLNSTQSTWSQDKFNGLQHVEYKLQPDGTLRFILETDYRPNLAFADFEREDWASVTVSVWGFDVTGEVDLTNFHSETASGHFQLPEDREHWHSIPEDAHDIVGYIGAVDYVSIAPYDEENMAITIRVNEREYFTKEETTWMTGPKWVIMDAAGNRLCEVDDVTFYDLRTYQEEDGDRYYYHHGLFPADCMPEGNQITLRAEHRSNYNIVYDEYTYTLVNGQIMDVQQK